MLSLLPVATMRLQSVIHTRMNSAETQVHGPFCGVSETCPLVNDMCPLTQMYSIYTNYQ